MLKHEVLKQEFVSLIEKNQAIVHKVVNLYCDNKTDREDLFQEILLQLWKSYPSFKQLSKFTTWMYRIALNTAIAHFRKSDRHKKEEHMPDLPDHHDEDESYDEKENRKQMLYKAINKLNRAEKAIIMLYMEENTYEEIAEITGMTVSNTGVKIKRTKEKLQQILKDMDYGN